MSYTEMLSKQTSSESVQLALLKGAARIVSFFHAKQHQNLVTYEPKDIITKWYSMDHPEIVEPIACTISTVYATTIGGGDLSADKFCMFGQYILGDFTEMDLPTTSSDTGDLTTTLNEIIATTFMLIVNGNYSLAFAYLRAAQMLTSLYTESAIETVESTGDTIEVTPYGL